MQLLPSSEHPLCGRLEEEAAQLAQALTPGHAVPSQPHPQAYTCSRLTLKSRDSSLLVRGV